MLHFERVSVTSVRHVLLEYLVPVGRRGWSGPSYRDLVRDGMQTTPMVDRWLAALPAAAAASELSAVTGDDLLRRWREVHRCYHTVEHLKAVLDVIDDHADLAAEPGTVRLAAWFHDAVYDPRAADNEERSAQLAVDVLSRLAIDAAQVGEVARLVGLTATHDPQPGDTNGALLVDADLAILAAAPDRYDRYAEQIRWEYRHLDNPVFTAGRAAVLRRLISAPLLYRILPDAAAIRTRAEQNMRRELDRLRPAS